jgi:hypothetical protein
MKLVSLATLKAYLDIPTDVTANYVATNFDILLNIIIDFVSDRIRLYLNRELELEQYTDYVEAGKRKYYLKAFPIINPSTMTVKVDTNTQTFESDYYIRENLGLLEFTYHTTYSNPKQIEVTYIGGYPTVNGIVAVPDSIQFACLLQCAFVFRRRKEVGTEWTGTPDVNRISTKYGGMDLLQEVKDILYLHRRQPGDL